MSTSSPRQCLLLAALAMGWSALADSTVVFNEVQYHPATAEPDMEWIEFHNQMSVNMDLSHWSLSAGVSFEFPEGTILAGGGYLVVASNPSALVSATGATNVLGPFAGRLSNSGERLELRNNNARLMDSVDYGTDGAWPVGTDGTGASLAKRDPGTASQPAANWRISARVGGTPGSANFPSPGSFPPVNLVAESHSWRVDNTGVAPEAGWTVQGYDESAWADAPAPLYGGDAPTPGGQTKSIPGLFNTGIGEAGQVLAPGSIDPHYTVLVSAEPASPTPPAPARVIQGHPAWLANDGVSSWLGPVNPGELSVAAGSYRYSTRFDLSGFDPTSASVTISVAADNRLNDILLNGVSRGLSFVGFSSFSPAFSVKTGFVSGLNTLEFLWANDGDGPNPAGFRAVLQGTARTLALADSRLEPVRPAAYLRRQFVFQGNPASRQLRLRAKVDDGAVFYLNGAEVLRFNMPEGPVIPTTPASTNVTIAGGALVEQVLAPGWLLAGTNVLAVELHQHSGGLNDAWFSAELSAELAPVASESDVALNEIGPAGQGFFIELANRRTSPISLAGVTLEATGSPVRRYAFPSGATLAAGGLLVLNPTDLGFLPASGDRLFLFGPGRLSVLDATTVKKSARGRFPDANGSWFQPSELTPGATNRFEFHRDVVINEILYHPRDEAASGSWVELYNRGSSAVDLEDWRFDSGIEFQFPTGTILAPGGYLVLARDPEAVRALHPGIAVVGPYTNTLSHSSDRLVLEDAMGNVADEVRYFDDGRWPQAADGGGSSLELRDPWADNAVAEAWAASRESAASGWSNYTYRVTAAAGTGPTIWKEFVFGLLDAGECLIDDIRVTETPAGTPVQLIVNGNFEQGSTGWRMIGTHRLSRVIVDPDNAVNHVLDLVATGPTEHMHNHIETTLANNRAVVNGRQYEVSFRARWISGANALHTRLYFNRVARTTRLAVPAPNGTPGARNSTYVQNLGPTFSGLRNEPVVPAPNQTVAISVSAADPQGVSSGRLYWSVNGGAWQNKSLAGAGENLWGATIPGGAAGSVVQYYVEATDSLGATSQYPAGGPASRALYIVNDQRAPAGALHNLRILMTPADTQFLHAATNVMSNESLGATVIHDEREVFHNVGVHLQGSERGRNDPGRVGFTLNFPPDNLFRGVHANVSIDRSGGYTGVGGDQDEILLKHALQHAGGLPGMYDDLVRVIPPRSDLTGTGLLILAKYGDIFLDSQYENGSDGSEFKLELIYYPTTTANGSPQGAKLPQPDEVIGADIGDLGSDPESYRWYFRPENNRAQDDYSQVIALAKAFSKTGTALDADTRRLMDVSVWMRALAFQTLWGMVDTYPYDNPHNYIVYFRPSDGRAVPFLWDMDYNFGAAATSPINRAVGNFAKIAALPGNQRLFLGHLRELITTTYNTNYLTPWINHFGGLAGQNFGGIRNYVDQRVKSVRAQFPAVVPFSITSNGGQDSMVDTPSATVSGRAWIDVSRIVLADRSEPLEFKWTSTTAWQVAVPLMLGTNRLQFLAYDFQGTLLGSNVVTVTGTSGEAALDSDGDGMPDAWEMAHGLNPGVPDGVNDPDGDGMSNQAEYRAGTDPRDAASVLGLRAQVSEGAARIAFTARAGRSYSLLAKALAGAGEWKRVTEANPAMLDREVVLTDPVGASGGRLYRVVTPRIP